MYFRWFDGWLRTTQSYHTQVCISDDMMASLEPHKVTTHKYVFQVIRWLAYNHTKLQHTSIYFRLYVGWLRTTESYHTQVCISDDMMASLEPHKLPHTSVYFRWYDGWLRTTQSYHTQVCISDDTMAGLEPQRVTTHKYVFQMIWWQAKNHTKLSHTSMYFKWYDGWLRTTQSYNTQVCISSDMMAGLEPHKVTTHKYVFPMIWWLA